MVFEAFWSVFSHIVQLLSAYSGYLNTLMCLSGCQTATPYSSEVRPHISTGQADGFSVCNVGIACSCVTRIFMIKTQFNRQMPPHSCCGMIAQDRMFESSISLLRSTRILYFIVIYRNIIETYVLAPWPNGKALLSGGKDSGNELNIPAA